jgi:chemotaxis protein methyltransferase CheR
LTVAQAAAVIEELETDLLMDALARAYGVDTDRYPRSTFEAWAVDFTQAAGIPSVLALIERLLHDREFGGRALDNFHYSDARLFSDVSFWRFMRDRVIPWLRTNPFVSLWLPECGHAAAVYSLTILFEEAGLTERTRIYATDSDSAAIGRAAQARLSRAALKAAQPAYEASGGTGALERYFDFEGDQARLQARLRAQVLWSQFDPLQGESFNEFHFIDGRFLSSERAYHAFKLMIGSLPVSGLLALNPQHGRALIQHNLNYKEWQHGLYQRVA